MERITLDTVLPEIFSHQETIQSEIWQQKISFEKEKLYLVEAASGRGKSTFCSYIVGYRNDYNGRLTFDGMDTKRFKPKQWTETRQRHISHLFQELRLFPELTAYENVAIKNNLTNYKTDKEIKEWFETLQIADKLDAKIAHMSFGQQQRVALIRALVQPFDFILLDEPISHLDDKNAQIMGDLVMEEAQRQGAGVIMTSIGKHIPLNYDITYKL